MYRIGLGYDIHRLDENRDLIIGGVKIPYELGLVGHSDADVLIHAIIDAMFGALALGDIGTHFPDTDEAYRGISSVILLDRANNLIHDEGYVIKIATASHYQCLPYKLEYAVFPIFKWITYKDIMVVFDKSLIKCDFLIDDYHKNLEGSTACKILMNKPLHFHLLNVRQFLVFS